VCPGDYPEQIVIRQPLTLKGVKSGNVAYSRITVPSAGLAQSTVLENGAQMFAQILIEGTDTGAVSISDIVVDGQGRGSKLGATDWFSAICFHNSSGSLSRIATLNQSGNGYGFGIFIDEAGSSMKTVSIRQSTVRYFDADGIRSNASATTLTADIRDNAITLGTPPTAYTSGAGISIDGTGSISGNRLVNRKDHIGIGIGVASKMTVVANTIEAFGIGIWTVGNSDTVKGNKVIASADAIIISASENMVEQNSLMNQDVAISFNCTGTGNTFIHNFVNDARLGVDSSPGGNTIGPNTYSNVRTIVGSPCS
jgi:hypothetical protein